MNKSPPKRKTCAGTLPCRFGARFVRQGRHIPAAGRDADRNTFLETDSGDAKDALDVSGSIISPVDALSMVLVAGKNIDAG